VSWKIHFADPFCQSTNGYEIQNFINNGAFGSVHSAIKKVAIKSLKKDFQQMANNEFRMLRKCESTNVIKAFEIFESKTEVKIVLELLKMDLAQFKDMYGKDGHRNL
jgi:serine/threonine protein kinase